MRPRVVVVGERAADDALALRPREPRRRRARRAVGDGLEHVPDNLVRADALAARLAQDAAVVQQEGLAHCVCARAARRRVEDRVGAERRRAAEGARARRERGDHRLARSYQIVARELGRADRRVVAARRLGAHVQPQPLVAAAVGANVSARLEARVEGPLGAEGDPRVRLGRPGRLAVHDRPHVARLGRLARERRHGALLLRGVRVGYAERDPLAAARERFRVAGGGVLGRRRRLGRGWRGGLGRGHREERVELGREHVRGVRALRRGRCHRGVELRREQVRHVRVRALRCACLLLRLSGGGIGGISRRGDHLFAAGIIHVKSVSLRCRCSLRSRERRVSVL